MSTQEPIFIHAGNNEPLEVLDELRSCRDKLDSFVPTVLDARNQPLTLQLFHETRDGGWADLFRGGESSHGDGASKDDDR